MKICGDCGSEESLLVEISARRQRHAVAQRQVLLKRRAAEIEVPVLEPRLFGDGRVLVDRERRGLRFVEDVEPVYHDVDLAGRQFRVDRLGRAGFHPAVHRKHEFRTDARGGAGRGRAGAHEHLRQPVAIPQIEEREAAEVPDAMHPAQQDHGRSDVRQPQLPARVRAVRE